ncbi:MAG: ABC transporter permease [Armatimonadota bacterium]
MKAKIIRLTRAKELPILLIFVTAFIYFSLRLPHFAELNGLLDFARQYSCQALIAVGLTLVIATGGIDISVGSVMGLCAVVFASLLSRTPTSITWTCILTMVVGCLCGLFNGFSVARLHLQPVAVTLSTMATARGLAYVIAGTGVSTISLPPRAEKLVTLCYETETPIILASVIFIIAWTLLSMTAFGRYVLAIGGNQQAAWLSGIGITRVKIAVYVASSMLASIGGIITASMMSTATTDAGLGYEFEAITAVLIGGTSIFGGEATVLGSIIGIATTAIINRGFGLMGISDLWRMMCLGVILILAVILDSTRKRILLSLNVWADIDTYKPLDERYKR